MFLHVLLLCIRIMIPGVKQVHALVKSLQQCAKDAGHRHPLMIGIDQENGAALSVFPNLRLKLWLHRPCIRVQLNGKVSSWDTIVG